MSITCSQSYNVTVGTCIDNASPLPSGNIGDAYSETLTASSLTAPLNWIVLNGTLPDGLTLDPDTGEIYGVPTVENDFSFQVQVTDANNVVCSKNFSLDVTATPPIGSCGWWEDTIWDQPLPGTGVPAGTSSWVPDPFTDGITSFELSLQQPQGGGFASPEQLEIIGNQDYTGNSLKVKISISVTACSGIVNASDGIRVQFKRNNVARLDEQIQAVGDYEYEVDVDTEASPITYKLYMLLSPDTTFDAGDIRCTVTLSSTQMDMSSDVGVAIITNNPLLKFVQSDNSDNNPGFTFTMLSGEAKTWQLSLDAIYNSFGTHYFETAPVCTLNGVDVPVELVVISPNTSKWLFVGADPFGQISRDADPCEDLVFVITSASVNPPLTKLNLGFSTT